MEQEKNTFAFEVLVLKHKMIVHTRQLGLIIPNTPADLINSSCIYEPAVEVHILIGVMIGFGQPFSRKFVVISVKEASNWSSQNNRRRQRT